MNFQNKKGVVIEGGVNPWQIFQQNENGTADISAFGSYYRVHQDFELPMTFHSVKKGKAKVQARIALESSGESIRPWTNCELLDGDKWVITFKGVPAGGPYRLETYMEYEGWDGLSSTRGDMVHNFGIGDIFVVAGQSNAAGRAKNPIEDAPEIGISLLRNSGVWDLATHPLGETTNSKHIGHFENHNPGHTPWLHFAKILKRELGYPIGIVMSAYGGAPLRWWNPAENGSLQKNMLEQLAEYDIHPKAMLWYQGEAEGYENAADTYFDRFVNFVKTTRKELAQPGIPIITVQLNRCMNPSTEELDKQWGLTRQLQVDIADKTPGVYVIPANDLALYDFIHNSSQGNLVIGERCAYCALTELYGKQREWKAPRIDTAKKISDDSIELKFSRIFNWINPYDVPADILPIEIEDKNGIHRCKTYDVLPDGIVLHFDFDIKKGTKVHGMWRMNPGQCTPCDCMRMPVLSFYGFPVDCK